MIKVEYIDNMGNDLRVVNAAKVSFDKASKWESTPNAPGSGWDHSVTLSLKDRDKSLIQFLARGCTSGDWDRAASDFMECYEYIDGPRHDWDRIDELMKWAKNMPTHWTPFAHCQITLRETIPIFLARQRFKHMIGFVYNEVSRRYVTDEPEFYVPDVWRKASADKKQGSTDEAVKQVPMYPETGMRPNQTSQSPERYVKRLHEDALYTYQRFIDAGICAEQARMVLPQSMMTSYYVTGSLYAFANAYNSRSRDDAQKEWKPVVQAWDEILRPLYPVSWAALVD